MNAKTFNSLMNQQVPRLTLRQRELLKKRLDELDEQQKGLAVIESSSATDPRCCPHCQGTALYRHGHVSGLQRYRCRTCRRTFNALTGTALARLRKKGKWFGFSQALAASLTLRKAAAVLQVHRNTALRWRHRFLRGLKMARAATLRGITEADETYFLESRKGCRKLQRPARRRGSKARSAGLSNELVCVLVARDRAGQTLDWVMGRGQMTKAALAGALQPVLAKDALLVSDKQPDLRRLCAGRAPRARGGQSERGRARQRRHPCPERQRLSRPSQTVAAALSRRCHGLSGQLPRLVSCPGQPPRRLWASCLGDGPGQISTFNSDIATEIGS